jgi:hypothetical protein
MSFAGAFGTWTVDDADLPDHISRTMNSPGSFRRSFLGTGRRRTQYDRWTYNLSWTMVGTTARDQVGSMAGSDEVIQWKSSYGTANYHAAPGSYSEQESGYQVYDLSLTLEG